MITIMMTMQVLGLQLHCRHWNVSWPRNICWTFIVRHHYERWSQDNYMTAFLTKKSYFNLIRKRIYWFLLLKTIKISFRQTESVSRSIVKATCAGGRWESIPHRSGNLPSQWLLKFDFQPEILLRRLLKSPACARFQRISKRFCCQISTDQSLLTSKVWFRTDRSKFGKVGDHDGLAIVNYPTR